MVFNIWFVGCRHYLKCHRKNLRWWDDVDLVVSTFKLPFQLFHFSHLLHIEICLISKKQPNWNEQKIHQNYSMACSLSCWWSHLILINFFFNKQTNERANEQIEVEKQTDPANGSSLIPFFCFTCAKWSRFYNCARGVQSGIEPLGANMAFIYFIFAIFSSQWKRRKKIVFQICNILICIMLGLYMVPIKHWTWMSK